MWPAPLCDLLLAVHEGDGGGAGAHRGRFARRRRGEAGGATEPSDEWNQKSSIYLHYINKNERISRAGPGATWGGAERVGDGGAAPTAQHAYGRVRLVHDRRKAVKHAVQRAMHGWNVRNLSMPFIFMLSFL